MKSWYLKWHRKVFARESTYWKLQPRNIEVYGIMMKLSAALTVAIFSEQQREQEEQEEEEEEL